MILSNKKSILTYFAIALFIALIAVYSVAAATEATDTLINDLAVTPAYNNLQDGNSASYRQVDQLVLKSSSPIKAVYLIFWDTAVDCTLTYGDAAEKQSNTFLHQFIKLPDALSGNNEITLTFDEKVNISDVYAFSDTNVPEWVQVWEPPHDRADLLLNTTHADDEQLFFAGILPYYTAKGYRVQVSYFTDHQNAPNRRHELLNGLWTVGVEHYPVISSFPDAYSESAAWAINNLKNAGFSEDDVIAYQTEILRRFKPQVAIGHDLNGEYGHGQHILNAQTLIKAVDAAKDQALYPESSTKYGVWDTPKLYIHLYSENSISLNWDQPLDKFGGKTAFQVTQNGFQCHKSQHYTWFNTWLNGNNGSITNATQIKTYSPCDYGLYRSTVGNDVAKNDFFENLISYDAQERIEQERLEKERLEAEESSRAAEESKRLESEAESRKEALAAKESREKAESLKLWEEQKRADAKSKAIIAAIVLASASLTLGVLLYKKIKK